MLKSIFFITSLVLLIYICPLLSQAQNNNHAFKIGEHIKYSIRYNLANMSFDMGYVDFKVDSTNNENIYSFTSKGYTKEAYSWLYKVNDIYHSESYSSNMSTLYFSRETYHAGETKDNKYYYNYDKREIYSKTKIDQPQYTYDTLQYIQGVSDILSTCYIIRDIDFSDCPKNKQIISKIILDNEIFEIYAVYKGKETIKNYDNKQYHCLKFTTKPVKGTIFTGDDDITVWVTDDKNKIPIKVSAKILIGNVNAFLTSASGL